MWYNFNIGKREKGKKMAGKMQEIRKSKGWSQQDLADMVGCRRETIGNIESGKYNPSLELADAIALFLGVTVYDLFFMKSEGAYVRRMGEERDKARESVVAMIKESEL